MEERKTALIVGASRGIGYSISKTFIENDWNVICPARSELDLTCLKSTEAFIASSSQNFNALIFSAGENNIKAFYEVEGSEFSKSFNLHCIAPFLIVQGLMRRGYISKNASIIFISSLYSLSGRRGRTVYSTTKHATNGLVKNLAIELGAYGITVNSVIPGFVDTDMTRKNLGTEGIKKISSMIPAGGIARPEQISRLVLNLCCDTSYVSGQEIVIDGGIIAGGYWDAN
jgi:3-oxoacyl-[acyl-carrier protein] reductase